MSTFNLYVEIVRLRDLQSSPLKTGELYAKERASWERGVKELLQSRLLTGRSYLLEKGPGPRPGKQQDRTGARPPALRGGTQVAKDLCLVGWFFRPEALADAAES